MLLFCLMYNEGGDTRLPLSICWLCKVALTYVYVKYFFFESPTIVLARRNQTFACCYKESQSKTF